MSVTIDDDITEILLIHLGDSLAMVGLACVISDVIASKPAGVVQVDVLVTQTQAPATHMINEIRTVLQIPDSLLAKDIFKSSLNLGEEAAAVEPAASVNSWGNKFKNIVNKTIEGGVEIAQLTKYLRTNKYDLIIDLHGSVPSVACGRIIRATSSAGYTSHELAHAKLSNFYHEVYSTVSESNPYQKMRLLAHRATTSPDIKFRNHRPKVNFPPQSADLLNLPESYILLSLANKNNLKAILDAVALALCSENDKSLPTVVLTGVDPLSEDECKQHEKINIISPPSNQGELRIDDLQALAQNCKLAIGNGFVFNLAVLNDKSCVHLQEKQQKKETYCPAAALGQKLLELDISNLSQLTTWLTETLDQQTATSAPKAADVADTNDDADNTDNSEQPKAQIKSTSGFNLK